MNIKKTHTKTENQCCYSRGQKGHFACNWHRACPNKNKMPLKMHWNAATTIKVQRIKTRIDGPNKSKAAMLLKQESELEDKHLHHSYAFKVKYIFSDYPLFQDQQERITHGHWSNIVNCEWVYITNCDNSFWSQEAFHGFGHQYQEKFPHQEVGDAEIVLRTSTGETVRERFKNVHLVLVLTSQHLLGEGSYQEWRCYQTQVWQEQNDWGRV